MLPREIVRKIRQIEIRTNKAVNTILGGEYHSVFKGQGVEFSEVRQYQAGDDIRSIDWNVTARMGHPFVKKFVEEREQTVMLLVDASASQSFGSQSQSKREIASEIAAVLAFSAIKNSDRIGLLIFTDQVEKYVPPKKGRQHVLRLVREILCFNPERSGTSINIALENLFQTQKRNCIAFLISDFMDNGFGKSLKVAAKKHDVIAVKITDPREQELTKLGLINLEDPETKETLLVDLSGSKLRQLYKTEVLKREGQLRQELKLVDTIQINTASSYVDPIVKFFKQREKRYR